ncbi:HNH endonuclease family protein [Desulfamplus magnetovallimortis]|uniref:HNH endonuclease family protein n=1 Tax=Desulfamplus magnetovallimortis TaxID=1246637 RepID=A0A1W1H9L5_9BACT|nr:HNH endonuclease [Desulfamplus magnetovallimortis]SLM29058.1 HNH endonuclease family protein [Desulfamplus magnetovallimortis]
MDYYYFDLDEGLQKREKQKARELRNSQWWKRKRSQGVCHYCKSVHTPSELTMDHIVPIARGGKSVKNNVVPCCKSCNSKKKQMLPLEWGEYMEKLLLKEELQG